jgi:hypothetical protein
LAVLIQEDQTGEHLLDTGGAGLGRARIEQALPEVSTRPLRQVLIESPHTIKLALAEFLQV